MPEPIVMGEFLKIPDSPRLDVLCAFHSSGCDFIATHYFVSAFHLPICSEHRAFLRGNQLGIGLVDMDGRQV